MQNQNQKSELSPAEIEQLRRELMRAEARFRRRISRARQAKPLAEFGKFGLTAVIIFVIVFVGMNFGAFEKQATFLLAKVETGEPVAATNSVTKKVEFQKPKLVVAKDSKNNRLALPPLLAEVAPPDNRLIIPSLSIHAPIQTPENVDLTAANWETIESQIQDALQNGVVSFPGTAKPGERGNAFITGHSSYYPLLPGRYKDVFALLPQIKIGDEIEVWQNERKFTYRVSDKKEVSPSDVGVLENTQDYRLTLMTCTPIGTALRRLIVTAELVKSA